MKRVLILLVAFALIVGVNAQDYHQRVAVKATKNLIDYGSEGGLVDFQKDIVGVFLGQSMNYYSIYVNAPSQVAYCPEINTVAFIHRAPGTEGENTGRIAFDYSPEGGSPDSWLTNIEISPNLEAAGNEEFTGCRYPSLAIFNPAGNTNPSDAYILSTGPCISQITESWGNTFEISAQIGAPANATDSYATLVGNQEDDQTYGFEMGPDGAAWTVRAGQFDAANNPGLIQITKVTHDGTDFSWDIVHEFTPDYTSEGTYLISDHDIAVDPNDGDHVYFVMCTYLNGDHSYGSGLASVIPHVWETIDGGATWTKGTQLDFTAGPFVEAMDTLILTNDGGSKLPYCRDVDATVDANGNLHAFTHLTSGSETWEYLLVNGWLYDNNDVLRRVQHYVDFVYDGADWSMLHVGSSDCGQADWSGIETRLHPQIGRDASGENIFYTYDNSPVGTPDSLNTAPDLFVGAWNVDGTYFEPINTTIGSAAEGSVYFPQTSPVVITKGASQWEIPVVFAMTDILNGTVDDDPQYMYIDGAELDIIDGNLKAKLPDVIVYPNPVADFVGISQGNKVEVYNVVGELVYETETNNGAIRINMSDYSAGTYIFKVYTEDGVVTKKVIRK